MAAVLANSFEGGTSGTTLTAAVGGNTGGASANFLDAVNVGTGATVAFDNAHAAHGTLSLKIATSGTAAVADVAWTTSFTFGGTTWFRLYLFFTANPAAIIRVFNLTGAGGSCGSLNVTTAGKLRFTTGTAGTDSLDTTNSIPLNAWFRVEGFLVASATVGQVEMKLFSTMDSVTATETQTSAASLNTTGTPTNAAFGGSNSIASTGPYWIDDIALSNTAYNGPAGIAGAASPAGAGSVTSAAIQGSSGTLAGTGSVTSAARQGAGGTAGGTGSVASAGVQGAGGGAAGAGSVTSAGLQGSSATAAGAGSVTSAAVTGSQGTPAGAGSVTSAGIQGTSAAAAGAGSVTSPGLQGSGGSAAGSGQAVAAPVQGSGASPAGSGSVSTALIMLTAASAAGLASAQAAAILSAAASAAGTGMVTATAVVTVQKAPGTAVASDRLTGSAQASDRLAAGSAAGDRLAASATAGDRT